jgi:RNA polymerase sporulation-specific sigma factor
MSDKNVYENLLKIIQKSLSNYEYKIWRLYLSGFSTSEIANQLNTDSKSVSNAIYRIRVKLKTSINNQSK